MSKNKKWIITLSGEQPLAKVRKQLVEAGFEIEEVFDEIGSITGNAEENVAGKLPEIAGVSDVSPEQPIDIGPPDSSTTW
jgi:hypothetical protein